MSRLGDLLKTERLRRNLSIKKVAKLGGVTEKYLESVEMGTRIIPDDQARRILKKMGIVEPTEVDFTLDEIAATVDLETVKTKTEFIKKKTEESHNDNNEVKKEEKGIVGSIWLDALSSVIKKVPVYNAVMKEVDSKLIPLENGKIENSDPDKVFYFIAPDDEMRGFRILKDDKVFIVPAGSPIDGAIMLINIKNHISLKKIKKLDAFNVMVQSFGRELLAESFPVSDIAFMGKAIYLETYL
ncbi:MAG: helix-turn-helix transcriptional regulator [Christensenellaceae bacterium]|nr:helix-turn-helix transcriptional regulator [Christensenellaceae bacterium]